MRVAILVLGLVLGVGVAHADEAADREEARREFALGQASDRQRDWQSAIEHYLRANDLVPHPNAMFNIATDYERLGKPREAAVWYQRYIDASPDSPDRDKVIRTLRELALRPGLLTIRTNPSGASVTIDGAFAGVSPYTGKVKGGPHRVVVEYDGQREERDARIDYGEPATIDIAIRGPAGTLRVVGTPPGAAVTVDEQPAGVVPTSVPVPAGTHAVRVVATGYNAFDTTATIEPGRETIVTAQLTRALGTMDEKPKLPLGYYFGVGVGADARGTGAAYQFEVGFRAGQYELLARLARTEELTLIDLMARWALTKNRLAPFLGFGYSFVTNDDTTSSGAGTGYLLVGGLRVDLTHGDKARIALLVESGLRYYPGLEVSDADPTTPDRSGLIVPVMATFQVMYR
ncbi:MAG TPA: PEGA domain-containing protein [Kofleriaceae bacterium]|nr:PEGA domain-containing protein [Kofleriaceae bacterium]